MQSLASQLYAFVFTMIMGLSIGLLFDFFKFTKGKIRPGKVFGYIADLSFWVITTVIVFLLLLIGNWGEIRLYVVIGVIIGAALYFKIFSSLVLWVLGGIYYYLRAMVMWFAKIIMMIWTAITYPFILVRNIVIVPIGYLSAAAAKVRRGLSLLMRRRLVTPLSMARNSVKNKGMRWWRSIFKKN